LPRGFSVNVEVVQKLLIAQRTRDEWGTRRVAAWGLIALLVAVFPANIYMLQAQEQFPEATAHV